MFSKCITDIHTASRWGLLVFLTHTGDTRSIHIQEQKIYNQNVNSSMEIYIFYIPFKWRQPLVNTSGQQIFCEDVACAEFDTPRMDNSNHQKSMFPYNSIPGFLRVVTTLLSKISPSPPDHRFLAPYQAISPHHTTDPRTWACVPTDFIIWIFINLMSSDIFINVKLDFFIVNVRSMQLICI